MLALFEIGLGSLPSTANDPRALPGVTVVSRAGNNLKAPQDEAPKPLQQKKKGGGKKSLH